MADDLKKFVEKRVSVLTNDGRNFVGVLKGLDQCVNVILVDCQERIYGTEEGVVIDKIGTYLLRGDNMYAPPPLPPRRTVIGELDTEKEKVLEWDRIRGSPLPPIIH